MAEQTHDIIDRRIDRFGPRQGIGQFRRAVRGDFFFQSGISQLVFPGDPVTNLIQFGNLHIATNHVGPLPQQIDRLNQRRKTIDAPPLGIQIHKLRGLPGIFGNGGEIEVLNRIGNETLFVFDLHRVKRTTIGIDANQKVMLLCEVVVQRIIRHCLITPDFLNGCR